MCCTIYFVIYSLKIIWQYKLFLEHLEEAKSDIAVIYGEDHPLYSSTLTGLLDELNIHERLKGIKPFKAKNKCEPKSKKQFLNYDTDRFEDVTKQNKSSNEQPSNMVAGW